MKEYRDMIQAKSSTGGFMWRYLEKTSYIILYSLNMFKVFFNLYTPIIWGYLILNLSEFNFKVAYKYIYFFIILMIISAIFQKLYDYFQVRFRKNMEYNMKSKMIETELNLRHDKIQKINAGQFISRFHSDVVEVNRFYIDVIPEIFITSITSIYIIFIFFKISIIFSIITMILSMLMIFVYVKFGKIFQDKYKKTRNIADEYFSLMYQTLNNIYEIKLKGIKKIFSNENKIVFNDIRVKETDLMSTKFMSEFICRIIEIIIFTLILIISSRSLFNREIKLNTLVSIMMYVPILSSNISSLSSQILNYKKVSISKERLEKLINPSVNDIEQFGQNSIENVNNIIIKNLSYTYNGSNKKALNNINIDLKLGDKIAIVGENGSGKSTLFKLLTRLIYPTEGEIIINGLYDISLLTEDCLRKNVYIVQQKPTLFHKSLRENMQLGINEYLEDDVIKKYFREFNLEKYVDELDYTITEKSNNISGGEVQKIEIIKSFISKKPIKIYDEPFSALDNEAIEKVEFYLNNHGDNTITIVCSHRLKSIVNFDRIFVLKNGKLLNYGTHNELLKNCEYYSELYYRED